MSNDSGSEDIAAAGRLLGLEFTEVEWEQMRRGVEENRARYEALRRVPLDYRVAPAPAFRVGAEPARTASATASVPPEPDEIDPPADPEDLVYLSVGELGRLLRSRRVTAATLAELYLERLRRYDPLLHCVISLTEERAREQARRADAEMAGGHWRGPLHGIPWGAKDLLAVRGYPTTWGAMPYRDQMLEEDATVVRRLDEAGAVLVAKLSLGALAMGDIWFGGKTRNPWNPETGSSGSSAGPAAATAAGLVGFSIGSETCGSIISPAVECGVTGLRPTFGRVSRWGAMPLAWSMDKIGPMCRSAADCGLVLAAIAGADGKDVTAVEASFAHQHGGADLRGLTVGYLEASFGRERESAANDAGTLEAFRDLGARLLPMTLPDLPIEALSIILMAEAAAAFDELTRSDRDELLVRQDDDAWPNLLRRSRLIPAVEYLQAGRVRALAQRALAEQMETVDLYLSPADDEANLMLTNLTGHPALALPNGLAADGTPTGITLIGRLYGEATLLQAGMAYQTKTMHHRQRPPERR
ncbi:MAG: amidase [Anaerolineae bacterium]|nr:amidase [Anaerolineae bacterium]